MVAVYCREAGWECLRVCDNLFTQKCCIGRKDLVLQTTFGLDLPLECNNMGFVILFQCSVLGFHEAFRWRWSSHDFLEVTSC